MYFTGKNRNIFELKNTIEILTALTDEYCNEILIGFFFFFLAYVIILLIKNKKSNYPPGPIGLPLIGYLPFLSEDVHLKLIELGKKYGDVFSIRLGSQNVVVLHGGDAIREALSKPEFMGRPPFGTLQFTNPLTAFFGDNMLLWKEQRRFVMKSLKNLGIRKTKFEEDVMAEINNFLEVLKLYNGQPIDLKTALQASISNNICALVFGKRFECNDPKRLFLDQNLEKAMNSLSMISSYSLFPWIRHIPFFQRFLSIEISRIRYDVLRKHFRKELDEHKKSLDPKHIRDYIDIFLLATESRKGKDLNTNFTDDMLLANILDLFVGGSETLTSSILWFVYSMAAFPDIQKKIVQEIIEIVGPGESPEFHHMKYMPYTYATIMELMRWKTIAALDKRYTVADVSINGYNIPKGTIILANFWNAHNDSRYWFEPEKFKPERFLSKDGKSVVKSKYYMPFSLGKRNCPGESMAYIELFLVKLGSQNIVVLHGTEAIREAFNKTEFLGRPPSNSLERINPYSPFFGRDFHAWKEQRRFVVQSMKDLGLGKTKIEDEVMDEVNHFVKVLKSHSGQPIDVKKPLSPSMSNNISALVFGKRYDYDNPDRQFLDENLEKRTNSSVRLL
ncbi:Cytochrome P450 18a1 like protein [Argiope bruennichi]|uniref:Cytochrome P450 18a1 like protein n=1 Tax=Argiope bruennichi TaxID=94029 RepID=A0A8T0F6D6_ARGBR|nr:Cytochrome P450 18a1 like protein [Argiope bruennichi]